MNEQLVLEELNENGVLVITFNRPSKKNAFTNESFLAARDAFRRANENNDVAVVVITGAGNDFTSGVDLASFGGNPDETPPFELMMDEIVALEKPLIAAAKGAAVGFGATALFHCDVVYVGESLKMRLPFVNLGLVPEAACSYLMQVALGTQIAAELLFTAEWINAERAVETGIARQSFPDEQLLDHAIRKAEEMAQWPVNSLKLTKRCLKQAHMKGIAAAREIEMQGMMALAGSPENVEAIMAFLEKRKPDFKNLQKPA
ncbi:MAG: enoyl-CoA hydratase/isomerase family protein [Pseudomonadales bacterium]|nr:enoyl-CoA hydratase/isomerase family protein [Pseudomonadales bacterium]